MPCRCDALQLVQVVRGDEAGACHLAAERVGAGEDLEGFAPGGEAGAICHPVDAIEGGAFDGEAEGLHAPGEEGGGGAVARAADGATRDIRRRAWRGYWAASVVRSVRSSEWGMENSP